MKEIKTNGIEVLFVEVPEDAYNFRLKNGYIWYDDKNFKDCCMLEPSGKWVILGKSTELSEEQMKEICEKTGRKIFRDYNMNYMGVPMSVFTVQESYLSLLEANGIVDRNKYGERKPEISDPNPSSQYYGSEMDELSGWQEAQSKVKHYLVLKRI
jgi:hypothetical protein